MITPLSYLKTQSDWQDFFEVISSKHFLFVPKYLDGKLVRVQLGHHVDHRLIESTELVLYNAHKCFLQIGETYSKKFLDVSHLPPIILRNLNEDTEVLTILGLSALSPSLKVKVKVESEKYDYILKLQSLRP